MSPTPLWHSRVLMAHGKRHHVLYLWSNLLSGTGPGFNCFGISWLPSGSWWVSEQLCAWYPASPKGTALAAVVMLGPLWAVKPTWSIPWYSLQLPEQQAALDRETTLRTLTQSWGETLFTPLLWTWDVLKAWQHHAVLFAHQNTHVHVATE